MSDALRNTDKNANIIKAIDALSAHRITSGQVVIDLQTAVKELVENSLDAGSTSIEVRFKNYGLESFEVIDNGSGISAADYAAVALKHHTSKLSTFTDLGSVTTFGFRGEALSSLCALAASVTVVTATSSDAPKGAILEFDRMGKLTSSSGHVARQRGTTVAIAGLFNPLPVRRKEFERNAKREFAKALHLLAAYALVPCASENGGVRLVCTNQPSGGKKSEQIRTDGTKSTRSSVSALWGPKTLEHLDTLDLCFTVETEKSVLRRLAMQQKEQTANGNVASSQVQVRGIISKFALNCGRSSTDRQFFFINGRPCQPTKVQKAFNDVYKTFNATQSPMVVADFILPTDSLDINVSPDKRTIFIHSEDNLVTALKTALEERFAPERSTFNVRLGTQAQTQTQAGSQAKRKRSDGDDRSNAATMPKSGPLVSGTTNSGQEEQEPLFLADDDDETSYQKHPARESPTADESIDQSTLLVGFESQPYRMAPTDTVHVDANTMDVDMTNDDIPPSAAAERTSDSMQVDTEALHQIIEDEDDESSAISGADTHTRRVSSRSSLSTMTTISRRVSEKETEHQIVPIRRFDYHAFGVGPRLSDPPTAPSDPPITPLDPPIASSNPPISPSDPPIAPSDPPISPSDHPIAPPDPLRELSDPPTGHSDPPTGLSDSPTGLSNLITPRDAPGPVSASALNSIRALVPPTAAKKDTTQMVLSTAGAAWNLKRLEADAPGGSEGPRKKQKVDFSAARNPVKYKEKLNFKSRLAGYALPGSQLPRENASTSDEEDQLSPPPENATPLPIIDEDGDTDMRQDDLAVPETLAMSSDVSQPDVIDLTDDIDMTVHEAEGRSSGESDSRVLEVVKSGRREVVTLQCDLSTLESSWARFRQTPRPPRNPSADGTAPLAVDLTRDAGLANDEDTKRADAALSRVIDKSDFSKMEVLGQFNRGFIIARHQKRPETDGVSMDDLFIIDQHAADEKYNFETLQQTTRIESQKLLTPRPLELSASDEMTALESLDILKQNGFDVEVAETDEDVHRPRLNLVSQPVSKSTVFDHRDLEELIHLIEDNPEGQMVRCSKARAMFAMRACRKSIMVGMSLTAKQMTSVIRHMGTMDQPWNCPHGRPTMRHLSDISQFGSSHAQRKEIDWQAFS